MSDHTAVYLGRVIPTKNFRAFIYSANGDQKLVNTWREFESHISTGLWFDTQENAKVTIDEKRPSRKSKNLESLMSLSSKE